MKLNDQLAVLAVKESELAIVEQKLEILYKQSWAKQMENDALKSKIAKIRVRLDRAEKLKNGLSGEHARWAAKIAELSYDFNSIVGNVLLSASTIAYLGPFTYVYRQECLQNWVKLCRDRFIPCSKNYSLVKTMGDPLM